ncbi:Amino acid transporter [Rubrobacter radiotolerans]|uniref:Amino acid transporter n=2 Tax=Rubrobacter radiotolerans TaxID=42256 RepID=A0A023X4W2_RUBRA|nr:Amino acid transporter [Rubrobacter radiotolerans]SMC06094.1 amino acid/polyamine/organocation transporter, APC superfamily [Rubrobacter radiotolerans DSM 5868]
MGIMRTKSVERAIRDSEEPEFKLKRSLGPLDLMVFGVGVIIGTGIFVLTGQAAANYAGPGVAISFLVSGFACALAALCYAEFASTVPVAGSAYTFSYVGLGEFVAWMIGWDLILEFTVGAATVAKGWGGYLDSVLASLGLAIPEALSNSPVPGSPDAPTGYFDLPAALIIVVMSVVLVLGITLSSRVNQVITALKVLLVLAIIAIGVFYIDPANLTPVIPPAEPGSYGETALSTPLFLEVFGIETTFGFLGVFTGAALVFFAYIGFDVVATTSEEARTPQRDLPIGILGALAVCTVLYVAVSVVLTGILPYDQLGGDAPVADALAATGLTGFNFVISVGILVGLTVVVMILLLGQSRVAFAMSRDNLLPRWFAGVHPRYRTPYRLTIATAVVAALLTGFLPLNALGELVNIGTLAAFVLVSIAVVVLRRSRPDLPRAFKVPLMPVLPVLSAVVSFIVMTFLPLETWLRFGGWMVFGVLVYFLYSRHASRLARDSGGEEP